MNKERLDEMAHIGIDVSKAKLDVAWLRDSTTLKVKTRVFSNNQKGIKALIAWLLKHTNESIEDIQVMMEATGIYHEALAYALYEAGAQVHVANPAHAKDFAKSLGQRSKTDRKDSITLARFLASRSHRRWQPEAPEVRHLRALLARLNALEKDIRREENRNEKAQFQAVTTTVLSSIQTVLTTLNQERDRLLKEINDHIDGHGDLKQDRQLLQSIPGIGRVLSVELLAMLRSRDFTSAGQCAAFAGLIPIAHESGTSVSKPPRLSKTGAPRLRAKLYMGAVVAIRYNVLIKRQYERLTGRGKSKMAALGAAMRKLVQMAFGVLKHQTSFNPQVATI